MFRDEGGSARLRRRREMGAETRGRMGQLAGRDGAGAESRCVSSRGVGGGRARRGSERRRRSRRAPCSHERELTKRRLDVALEGREGDRLRRLPHARSPSNLPRVGAVAARRETLRGFSSESNSGDGSVRPRARRRPWEGKETRYAETRTRGGMKHARRARASICARVTRARDPSRLTVPDRREP